MLSFEGQQTQGVAAIVEKLAVCNPFAPAVLTIAE